MGLTEKDSIKERARPMGDFTDWTKNGNTVLLGKEETPFRMNWVGGGNGHLEI